MFHRIIRCKLYSITGGSGFYLDIILNHHHEYRSITDAMDFIKSAQKGIHGKSLEHFTDQLHNILFNKQNTGAQNPFIRYFKTFG